MMQKSRKPNSFITPITRDMDQKLLPAAKMETFCHQFKDFYFAVSASENDANSRKPNLFITPITRDMASSKNGKRFVTDFYQFYFAVSASENDAKSRRPNSFIIISSLFLEDDILSKYNCLSNI